MQLLQQVEIPEYIIKVKMSNSRRKRYYSKKSKKTWTYKKLEGKYEPITEDYEGPPYELPAPKSKLIKVYEGEYEWKSNYIYDKSTGEKVLANPQSAGKARHRKLSGNDFASGYGSPHIRAKLVRKLKEFYRPFVQEMDRIDTFPLWVDWHLYTTVPKRLFDGTNFWFYYKYFEDALTDWGVKKNNGDIEYFRNKNQASKELVDSGDELIEPIMPDDSIKFVTKPGTSPIFHPVEHWEDRKFVFNFFWDDRDELKGSEIHSEFYD